MTAHCPMCGGKWDVEGKDFEIDLRCGDEHDIHCGYCNRVITFVLDRENLEIIYKLEMKSAESYMRDLEEQIDKITESLERISNRRKEMDK